MGDLDREAKIKKEAEERKRQEEAEQRVRDEQERLQQQAQQAQQREAEAKRAEAAAAAQQPQADAPQKEAEQAEQPADPAEEKQLRKRESPDGQQLPPPQVAIPAEQLNAVLGEPPAQPAAAPPNPHPEPESYTLCSPQLLHLDVDDTPLWFNGWLLDNKFADKRQKKFGSFKHYLIEPREVREPGAWQLHENNECCLTTDAEKMHKFGEREVKLLERMMAKAREVGAPGA
jgi:Tfp pilus assembly protein FimV